MYPHYRNVLLRLLIKSWKILLLSKPKVDTDLYKLPTSQVSFPNTHLYNLAKEIMNSTVGYSFVVKFLRWIRCNSPLSAFKLKLNSLSSLCHLSANKITFTAVSKTTKELLLEWDKDTEERAAVSVAKDLRMPQFAMKRITTNKCNSQYHMGESCKSMFTGPRTVSCNVPSRRLGHVSSSMWDVMKPQLQGFSKRRAPGCEKFLPCPAWVVLSKTGPPFSGALYFILVSRI